MLVENSLKNDLQVWPRPAVARAGAAATRSGSHSVIRLHAPPQPTPPRACPAERQPIHLGSGVLLNRHRAGRDKRGPGPCLPKPAPAAASEPCAQAARAPPVESLAAPGSLACLAGAVRCSGGAAA